jgi:sulfonate transport system ATP-binding protein
VGSARLAELEAEVLDRVMKRGGTELQRAKANA